MLVLALGGAADDQHVVGDVGVGDEHLLPVEDKAAVRALGVVLRLPTSEPASGSVIAIASTEPLEMPPRIFFFWSSLPKRLVAPATISVVA